MTLTILDIEDAELEGKAFFRKAIEEIEMDMFEEIIEVGIAISFNMIPDETMQMIKSKNPKLYKQMHGLYGDQVKKPKEGE